LKIAFIATVIALAPLASHAATPLEPDALMSDDLKGKTKLIEDLVRLVRANGYRCNSISSVRSMMFSKGFVLICNHFDYKYEIEDKGGNWQVTVD
jgi:hypothetical protein